MTVVVVLGVSGSGKTTVGTELAKQWGVPFADADDFHPLANVRKMAEGIPLTDADRWPWLQAMAAWIDNQPGNAVLACSALHRSYRDYLAKDRPVRMVYLKISPELAAARVAHRSGHFFPPSLIASQFADLEEPSAAEGVQVIDASQDLPTVVAQALQG
jgi:gluconokinase